MTDAIYMKRCLELAKLGLGRTKTNPLVGCVIVHQNNIIAEGYHSAFGKPHAEVEAFNKVKDKSILKECAVYVNLEPCSFVGKTPACAALFEANPCKRLIVGMLDPNPRVAGKGIERLRKAGIETTLSVLEEQCQHLNKAFIKSIHAQQPYVIAKWAQSDDGFIGSTNERVMISNDLVNTVSQKWRAEIDAYLIGNNTLRIDQPRLDLREFQGNQPLRCILGNSIDLNNPFFENETPGILFTHQHPNQLPSHFKAKDISNPLGILKYLYQENVGTLMIEGGRQTIQSFLHLDLVDELRIITNHALKLQQGISAPELPDDLFFVEAQEFYRDNSINYFQRIP